MKKALTTALISGTAPSILHAGSKHIFTLDTVQPDQKFTLNDTINVGMIGMGIMGFNNAEVTVKVPGVKIVAACDLYNGRLERAKEVYGKDLFTTRNYQEILDRKDIDAVIISTTDHWHDRIAIEAMNKGKHVYCEKPMVHKLEEGAAMIEAQKKTGRVVEIGSQRVSSVVTEKTKELYESGVIGELIMVETWMDRHSSNGAWQYAIPTDANQSTIDWDRFLGDAPKVEFDPERFFHWRNYRDYGTGIAGDLFVHLFSALHTVISSAGPNRIYCTGGLRYWKDGRDVPDIALGLYDYPKTETHPAFNLQMRVNFVDGSERGEGLKLIGSDGVIDMGWNSVKVTQNKISSTPTYGGWDSFDTFSAAQQKEYEKWYKSKYPVQPKQEKEADIEFKAPSGYSANLDHHKNFYAGIREKKKVVEDTLFGMQAAGPALASNKSYFEKKIIHWDPEKALEI
ncbi:MAG TPA: Gfo/Idh/MocA family oxidoreductase [Ohtaekwangia sp.]|nr:Gfo/Idh/MocA family oxidoreductase [Ohtaekwangia sp.]